jgi:hypothetical protein
MAQRPAVGGGRWVEVDPARLRRWLDGFVERHGAYSATPEPSRLRLVAADGCVTELYDPPGATATSDLDGFVAEAGRPRRLGLVLARQSAVAVGVAEGEVLVVSKVDTSYVQSRTAAGGWSQQRFARRRENQAKAAAGSAGDIVARLLLPEIGRLAAVVGGGNSRTVDAILSDPRLTRVAALRTDRFLDVPEPRLAVLQRAVVAARAIRIRIVDPPRSP